MSEDAFSKDEYDFLLDRAKQMMKNKSELGCKEAEKILDELEKWRPMRLGYICERVELMLLKGEDKKKCRDILDTVVSEKYFQPLLGEIFRVKQLTFEENSLEWELCSYSMHLYNNDTDICREYLNRINQLIDEVLNSAGDVSSEEIKKLADLYYITRNMTMYFVLMMTWCKLSDCLSNYREYILEDAGSGLNIINLEYLARQFMDGTKHAYVLINTGDNIDKNLDVLAVALQILGHEVILLKGIKKCNGIISPSKALEYSIKNANTYTSLITLQPLKYRLSSCNDWQDNVSEILIFLADNIVQKGAMIFFTNDDVMESLIKNHDVAMHIQRMSSVQPTHFINRIAYGWAGSYLKYMGYIYGFDIADRLGYPTECDFSIVIPVRNNSEALKYTLRTCLQIEYDGEYEIVVSDNSDQNDASIEDLCKEFNDKRIRYYRTPFMLPLPKSFEFAYMQARGDFILSIGADDGIFPWALKVLKILQGYMGDCEIIKWKRGFYAWPGFNYGQQNCLSTFYPKEPSNIEYSIKLGRNMLFETIDDVSGKLYELPLLYINSGFKRKYLKRLMNKTGRLWDTSSQDVPIGTVNILINEKILCTQMPLTIAGMMSKSIGYQSGMIHESLIDYSVRMKKIKRSYLLGGYANWKSEGRIPFIPVDIVLFYGTLLKMYAMKMIEESELDRIYWKKIYQRFIDGISIHDVAFENYMSEIRYSASQCGPEVSRMVENLYAQLIKPVLGGGINYSMERMYPVGVFSDINMINIDGDEFNIKNIEDAVHFLSKLLHICNL